MIYDAYYPTTVACEAYLGLNAVETSEPQDLSPPQLPLGVVDLVLVVGHVLVHDVVGAGAVSRLLEAFEVAGGYGGDQLSPGKYRKVFYVSREFDR